MLHINYQQTQLDLNHSTIRVVCMRHALLSVIDHAALYRISSSIIGQLEWCVCGIHPNCPP